MSFFTTVPAKTNPIGDSFLGGFNEGMESGSRERDLASATKRQHYLQEELYKEDYQKAKPSLDAIINNEAWSPSQKQIEIERSAEIPLSVKDRATKAYNNQVAEQQKAVTQKTVQAFNKESTEFVANALGIITDLKGDTIPTPGLTNLRDLDEEGLIKFSTLSDLYRNNLLQGDSQATAWARAKQDFDKNKSALMAEAQEEAKLSNDLKMQEIRDYEAADKADKVKLIMDNPNFSDRQKIIALKGEGIEAKEALNIIKKNDQAQQSLAKIENETKALSLRKASQNAYKHLIDYRGNVPRKALEYASRNADDLLSPKSLAKLKDLGVNDEVLRRMKGEKRKATQEELGEAYQNADEKSIVKWLKDNELEE